MVLKGDPITLICQNINFSLGGIEDVWKKAGKNLGLEIEIKKPLTTLECKNNFNCSAAKRRN